MRPWRRTAATSLLLLAVTGLPSLASAQPEHIRIQFSAPKSCPDGTAFTRALRQRTGRFQLGSGVEQTRVFVVTITAADPLFAGRLEIQGPGTGASVRNVSGYTCDAVMEALALMTALAIDPNGPNGPNGPNAPGTVNAPSAAPPSPPVAPSPAGVSNRPSKPKASGASLAATPATASPSAALEHREPEAPRTEPAPLPAPPPAPPLSMAGEAPATKPKPSAATGWKWSAGVQGGGSLHVSPTLGFGGLLFAEAAAPGAAVLAPVLRAGLFLNQSDVTMASGAGAEFQWAAALVEGCPIRLVALDSRIGFFPCLAFHLGVLRGQGRNLDQPETRTDLWADLGPVARIRIAVLARLFLEVQGMLAFPLRRLTFDVQDRGPADAPKTVFAVPVVGLLAGIGVGYELE